MAETPNPGISLIVRQSSAYQSVPNDNNNNGQPAPPGQPGNTPTNQGTPGQSQVQRQSSPSNPTPPQQPQQLNNMMSRIGERSGPQLGDIAAHPVEPMINAQGQRYFHVDLYNKQGDLIYSYNSVPNTQANLGETYAAAGAVNAYLGKYNAPIDTVRGRVGTIFKGGDITKPEAVFSQGIAQIQGESIEKTGGNIMSGMYTGGVPRYQYEPTIDSKGNIIMIKETHPYFAAGLGQLQDVNYIQKQQDKDLRAQGYSPVQSTLDNNVLYAKFNPIKKGPQYGPEGSNDFVGPVRPNNINTPQISFTSIPPNARKIIPLEGERFGNQIFSNLGSSGVALPKGPLTRAESELIFTKASAVEMRDISGDYFKKGNYVMAEYTNQLSVYKTYDESKARLLGFLQGSQGNNPLVKFGSEVIASPADVAKGLKIIYDIGQGAGGNVGIGQAAKREALGTASELFKSGSYLVSLGGPSTKVFNFNVPLMPFSGAVNVGVQGAINKLEGKSFFSDIRTSYGVGALTPIGFEFGDKAVTALLPSFKFAQGGIPLIAKTVGATITGSATYYGSESVGRKETPSVQGYSATLGTFLLMEAGFGLAGKAASPVLSKFDFGYVEVPTESGSFKGIGYRAGKASQAYGIEVSPEFKVKGLETKGDITIKPLTVKAISSEDIIGYPTQTPAFEDMTRLETDIGVPALQRYYTGRGLPLEAAKLEANVEVLRVFEKYPADVLKPTQTIKATLEESPTLNKFSKPIYDIVSSRDISGRGFTEVYGSVQSRTTMGAEFGRLPHDIDLAPASQYYPFKANNKQYAPAGEYSKAVEKALKDYGVESNQIGREANLIIYGKGAKTVHLIDIHPLGEKPDISETISSGEKGIGFGLPGKSIVFNKEKIPTMSSIEQTQRKGLSAFRPRELNLAPEPHRLKDIGDYFTGTKYIIKMTQGKYPKLSNELQAKTEKLAGLLTPKERSLYYDVKESQSPFNIPSAPKGSAYPKSYTASIGSLSLSQLKISPSPSLKTSFKDSYASYSSKPPSSYRSGYSSSKPPSSPSYPSYSPPSYVPSYKPPSINPPSYTPSGYSPGSLSPPPSSPSPSPPSYDFMNSDIRIPSLPGLGGSGGGLAIKGRKIPTGNLRDLLYGTGFGIPRTKFPLPKKASKKAQKKEARRVKRLSSEFGGSKQMNKLLQGGFKKLVGK